MKNDLISKASAIDIVRFECGEWKGLARTIIKRFEQLPSAQSEEASMILGASKDGVRLWYQCSACGEPVNADDNYCCNCGRKFING